MKNRADMVLYAAILATLIFAVAVIRQVRLENMAGAVKYEKVKVEVIDAQIKSGNISHKEADYYEKAK